MPDKNAVKITISYDDGSTKELNKGVCWNVDDDRISAYFVDCDREYLSVILNAAVQIGYRLGVYDDTQYDDKDYSGLVEE